MLILHVILEIKALFQLTKQLHSLKAPKFLVPQELKELYKIDEVDIGPEVHNCSMYSAVLIKENIKIINNQLYIFSYFDNENSVNRYYDLTNHLADL